MFRYFEWWILAIPLAGALSIGLLGKRLSRRVQNWVSAAVAAGTLFVALPPLIGELTEPGLVGRPAAFSWIKVWSGDYFVQVPLALHVDALSILLSWTVILGVLAVMWWALQSKTEPSRHVMLALLSGALASLLALVLADNLLFLLLGWSLAGWCTYGLLCLPTDRTEPGAAQDRPPLPMLVFSLVSDLCMLVAAAVVSGQFASLSIHHLVTLEPGKAVSEVARETMATVVTLLLVSAMMRAAQLPFHDWRVAHRHRAGRALVHGLSCVLPAIYLLARIGPLVDQVAYAGPLLSWWGALSALLLAASALCQPRLGQSTRWIALSQGGLLFLALGVGAHPASLAFLPAYALSHTLIQLAIADPAAGPDGAAAPRLLRFGLAAVGGLPLMPSFAFATQVMGATYPSVFPGVLAALTTLLLAASATRTALSAPALPGVMSGREMRPMLLISGVVGILGVTSLWSPVPLSAFLQPVLGYLWLQPAWWWFAIAAAAVGLGVVLGWLLHSHAQVLSSDGLCWIGEGYRTLDLYARAIARPLLLAGQFLALQEAGAARWTFGLLGRLVAKRAADRQRPDDSVALSVVLFALGVAGIAAYLLWARLDG